ncbi:MAG TPA: TIGR03000 domain-containing protein [Pirellulaceae bacterium]|nr:TIGR03000 domain-containing protein [Pirellulaceae bacterium]HMO90801.1 TIGR03000 domain-containing protein [Pirellulaceae bacterium]HMP68052.1 TIGR03000 domain-containing protein [Pirellulaceae bacterium]
MNKKKFQALFGFLTIAVLVSASAAEAHAGWGSFGSRGGSWGSRGGSQGSLGSRGGSLGSLGSRGGSLGSLGSRGGSLGSLGSLGSRGGSWGSRGGSWGSHGSWGGHHHHGSWGGHHHGSHGYHHGGYHAVSAAPAVYVSHQAVPQYTTVPVQNAQPVRTVVPNNTCPNCVQSGSSSTEVVTTLTLAVPTDAVVELCGQRMKTTGDVRKFSTSQLASGQSWQAYEVRVTYMDGERTVSVTKTIDLLAGDNKVLKFDSVQEQLVAVAR